MAMARTVVHAPDGSSITGALCQEVTGDVATAERDVNCGECLDALDRSDRSFEQLAQPLKDLRNSLGSNASGPKNVKTRRHKEFR